MAKGKLWSKAECTRLRQILADGYTHKEAALALGRSYEAIRGETYRHKERYAGIKKKIRFDPMEKAALKDVAYGVPLPLVAKRHGIPHSTLRYLVHKAGGAIKLREALESTRVESHSL